MNEATMAPKVPQQETKTRYERPRLLEMTEKEILNSFQITQSMGAWWTNPTCC
ncbi:MAG: hypothetical protein ABI837_02750 [Acidobacteriota bacterium]